MRGASNNILARKQPVAPAEAADVVESLQVENCSFLILSREFLNTELFGCSLDICEELAMRPGTVGAELVQDLG